jgi:TonB family protein
MDILTLPNLAAYTVQVTGLIALATFLAWVLRIDAAPLRYGFWRILFAVCLMLPLLQGRQLPAPAGAPVAGAVDTAITIQRSAGGSEASTVDWRAFVLPLLAAGAIARLSWLALNFLRLRRLRRAGEPANECGIHVELCETIGVRPEIRYVAALRQPVTFGFLRPVVLLPTALSNRSDEIQQAVISHELFHVKRRDWAWLLLEELVCALLWFNPAIWWLVSRLHLAREVVVDELAVLATGRRRAYVEALMAFADDTSLAPVAAFGGRAQLFHRIVLLSKESAMSARRLLFTLAAAAATLGAGAWHVVEAFPLVATDVQSVRQNAPGPLEQRARAVTPENPIPRRTNSEAPFYPGEARAAGARGSVTLMITLDELGRVAEARRMALVVESTNPKAELRLNSGNPIGEMNFLINQSREQSDALRAIALAMENAAFQAIQGWRYEPPANAPISFPVLVSIAEGADAGAPAVSTTREAVVGGGVRADGALRVGGTVRTPVKIKDVRPVYPPVAQAARVSGVVILEARVGADGSVEDAHVLRSIPLLDQAAVDAVMQWRFRPTLLNGVPTPVIMTVTVNFALQKPAEQPVEVAPEGAPAVQNDVAERPATARRQMPAVIKEVKPRYTREALDAGIQGIVEVEATIVDGKVSDARVTRSLPMLDEAALEAVRQWEFTRIAEPVTVNIELSFTTRKR